VLHALNVETPSPENSVANSPILPLGIGPVLEPQTVAYRTHERISNLRFNRYRLLYSLLISL